MRLSYLYSRNSYTGKTTPLHWDGPQVAMSATRVVPFKWQTTYFQDNQYIMFPVYDHELRAALVCRLTHWGEIQIVDSLQTVPNAFSWKKIKIFWIRFFLMLFVYGGSINNKSALV